MKITLLGCGNMGSALAERLSAHHELFLYDHNPAKSNELAAKKWGTALTDPQKGVEKSEIVILSFKPQSLEEAAPLLKSGLKKGQLLVSILAGTTIATLKKLFPGVKIVRMMPNLAISQGEGAIGIATEEKIDHKTFAKNFETLGKLYWISEKQMDAFSALAGSGPAFVFTIVEGIVEAGIAMGFSATEAQNIAIQMIRGSLTLLEESGKHPGELRWQVSSPGGTTIEGIKKLEQLGLRTALIETFIATYNRNIELSSK